MSYRIDMQLTTTDMLPDKQNYLAISCITVILFEWKRLICVAKACIHILTRMMQRWQCSAVYVDCARDQSVAGLVFVNSALTKLYWTLSFFQAKTSQPSVEIDQEITSDMVSSFHFTKDTGVTVQIVSCLSVICLGTLWRLLTVC